MIRIRFSAPINDVTWERWRKACEAAVKKMEREVATGRDPVVNEQLYKKKEIKGAFYFSPQSCFRGKCAYCETFLEGFRPDIEHFRPKLGVTDENDVPVMVDYGDGKGMRIHRGYYWRAYSTENLLPSCVYCNQPTTIAAEKIGKHNRFPVLGPHALNEAEIAAEQPLLINPLQEDPESLIGVDLETGWLVPLNGSRRAEMSIRVFGLNLRDQLVERRKSKIREIQGLLGVALGDPKNLRANVREILKKWRGEGEYTLVVRAVLKLYEPLFRLGDAIDAEAKQSSSATH